ncbi:MAG: glutamate--tRNA ligase [Deltaproteobacteria bacterium]|nr:glutamate--tRNA ligase [Deltaproteobacteria bacterium]
MEVRTRFAPSPTGYLHVGGARTAIFNWLFARHNKGKFILRIEDTDQERSTDESTNAILDSMRWLGMDWDEGPFFQAKRVDIYNEHVERLIKDGKAYYCTCTPEELEAKRQKALSEGKKPKYDGKCRGNTRRPDVPAAVRFLSPDEGYTVVEDTVKGRVVIENAELDDLIIRRSDGWPTYNFCVVVDDATMGMTHVIRGDDHLNNTPRQIQIYEALGYQIPKFGHVPMILGSDKTRLSKRHGATSVMAYKEMGYLPEAMLNYLVRLGWSHGDQEIFSREELIEKFNLENIGKSAGVFNPEKFLWLNAHYIKESDTQKLSGLLSPFLEAKGFDLSKGPRLKDVVSTLKERSKTILEMSDFAEFYFREEIIYDEKASEKFLKLEMAAVFEPLLSSLQDINDAEFGHDWIEKAFNDLMAEKGMKLKDLAQPVRVALTGGTISPGIFEVMEVLGKDRTLLRLRKALNYVISRS